MTGLGDRGYQGFCDISAEALFLKSVTMAGEGGCHLWTTPNDKHYEMFVINVMKILYKSSFDSNLQL